MAAFITALTSIQTIRFYRISTGFGNLQNGLERPAVSRRQICRVSLDGQPRAAAPTRLSLTVCRFLRVDPLLLSGYSSGPTPLGITLPYPRASRRIGTGICVADWSLWFASATQLMEDFLAQIYDPRNSRRIQMLLHLRAAGPALDCWLRHRSNSPHPDQQ